MNISPRRKTNRILAATLGGGLALLLALAVLIWMRGGTRLAPVTDASLALARQQWEQNRPPNYDMTIRVNTDKESIYQVQVRNGVPKAMWQNDQPRTERRSMDAWTVDGMLDVIDLDLETISRRASGGDAANLPQLALRGQFDHKWGIPRQYYRIDSRSNHEVAWEIIVWEPLP